MNANRLVPDSALAGNLLPSVAPTCHICHAPARELFVKGDYPIYGCGKCGYRFAQLRSSSDHVEEVYGDDYFFGGGPGYPDYLQEADLIQNHGRRYASMLRRYVPAGSVLDVGAAAGFLLKGLIDSGWQGAGTEPNPKMAAYGREQLGLEIYASSLEAFRTDKTFDLVTMIQVMGHFVDPVASLAAAARLTRPDGWWVIETWNPESVIARLFGKGWHAYCPPSGIRYFPPRTLTTLVSRFGFQEVTRGRVLKLIRAAHAKAVLSHNMPGLAARLVMPVLNLLSDELTLPYPSEDVYWALYKRSG